MFLFQYSILISNENFMFPNTKCPHNSAALGSLYSAHGECFIVYHENDEAFVINTNHWKCKSPGKFHNEIKLILLNQMESTQNEMPRDS